MNGACPVCGIEDVSARLRKDKYEYRLCSTCGSATLLTGWDDASYDRDYFEGGAHAGYHDYGADRRLHLETAERRLDALTSYLPPISHVVDVGAAYGYTLQAARDRGWTAVGVEISMYATKRMQEQGLATVHDLGDIQTETCDAVVLGQVLEHTHDPNDMLAKSFNVLRPGGAVFIETWNRESRTAKLFGSRWQQISPPSVVHLFSERGLHQMLRRTGFEVLESRPWRKTVSVAGYLGVVSAKLPTPLGKVLLSKSIMTSLGRLPITYRFDDLIAVVARRPHVVDLSGGPAEEPVPKLDN